MKKNKNLVVLILCWLGGSFSPLWAQPKLLRKIFVPDVDSQYVRLYKRKLMVYNAITRKDMSFFLRNKSNTATVRYEPNVNNNLTIGVLYAGIGLEYSLMALKNKNADNLSLYGNTYLRDFQLNLYAQQFGIDIIMQKYKGFYMSNPQDFDKQWLKGSPFPQREDLVINNEILNFYYVFKYRRFSYQAAFRQTRQQIKSAGSFVAMASLSRYDIAADSSIIPTNNESFDSTYAFSNARFAGIALMPGYGHTFVYRKWYISATLFLGLGIQSQKYGLGGKDFNDIRLIDKNNIRLAAGYNTDRFFSGISYLGDNKNNHLNRLAVVGTSRHLRFFIGVRF